MCWSRCAMWAQITLDDLREIDAQKERMVCNMRRGGRPAQQCAADGARGMGIISDQGVFHAFAATQGLRLGLRWEK